MESECPTGHSSYIVQKGIVEGIAGQSISITRTNVFLLVWPLDWLDAGFLEQLSLSLSLSLSLIQVVNRD
jgi:hypothetical protein